jgi:Ran-binding protein 3
VFGSALGSSAFSTLGGGSKLSSFATPGSSTAPKIEGISSKPAKAFGATNDTDEESGGETDEDEEATAGEKSTADQDKKDKRFYEQHIETGEEGETTMFAQRAKLYHFDKAEKKWVERGSGMLKLNISDPEPASSDKANLSDAPEDDEALPPRKVHARLLLRAEGSQRVVLNSPIVKGAKFGDDVEPKTQAILFLGRLAGAQAGEAGLDMLQVKVSLPGMTIECMRTQRD